MPMLGDMLAGARERSGGFIGWLAASDPTLAARVKRAAAALGMNPAGYVRASVADFARFAAEEDWATLTSNMRDSDDPGTICLLAMVQWRLTAKACGTHSHHHHHHHHHHHRAAGANP